jgi:paraquat-inducible protein B
MDEPPPRVDVPLSLRRRSRWPNLVWAIPLVALLIVAYLGVSAFRHRGETVTVTFARADGARPGETKVLYQGVDAGQLVKIEPNKDGRSLDFKLRMVAEAEPGLNSNARFWLIGASPNITDFSALKAVLTGVAIGYAPGEGGAPTRSFQGLQKAPVILPGEKGVRYRLKAQKLGSVREGSLVLFHGQVIGKVSEVDFDGKGAFNLAIFIYQNFDALIGVDTRFWKLSSLRLNFNDGITANFAPLGALLAGGVEIEAHPDGTEDSPHAPPDQEFILYESHSAARAGLAGPTVAYEFLFSGDAGTLEPDAAVSLLGFEIGAVRSVRLAYDPRSGEPQTLAVADVYPQLLHLQPAQGQGGDGWREATDAKLEQLARMGYRARLKSVPALLGASTIALVKTPGAASARLELGDRGRFPTAVGAGFEDLSTQASQLLAHLNAIPFEQIGDHLRTISARLDQFVGSPELKASLTHVGSSVASLDAILSDARPQLGPLLKDLKKTAAQLDGVAADAHRLMQNNGSDANLTEAVQQLSDAARSIRSLSDYLSRHPEALLRGKGRSP